MWACGWLCDGLRVVCVWLRLVGRRLWFSLAAARSTTRVSGLCWWWVGRGVGGMGLRVLVGGLPLGPCPCPVP